MHSSDHGDLALRVSTLLVLTATMLGLLVWYGSITGGRAVAASLLDQVPGTTDLLATATLVDPTLDSWTGVTAAVVSRNVPVSSSALLVGVPLEPLSSHRQHWEEQYMYGVSALAGTWVLARVCLGWRFDRRTLSVVPRSEREDRNA